MIETGDILYVPILYQPIGHDAQLQQVSAPSPELSGPYRCLRQVWLQVKIGLCSKGACLQGPSKPHACLMCDLRKPRSAHQLTIEVAEMHGVPVVFFSSVPNAVLGGTMAVIDKR